MDEIENENTQEEIVDSVSEALNAMGFSASSQDTGGGMMCVILQRKGGGEIVWGTADFTWGASVEDADGNVTSAIQTECPSGCKDVAAIVDAISRASIEAGALV